MVDPNVAEDYYYAHNHLYSPVALMEAYGEIVERYEYDAYGKMTRYDPDFTAWSGSEAGNPYYFTGRRLDVLDDGNFIIQYSRNRYYDYKTGRWLNQDPIGYQDGPNLYAYVNSNPVNRVDPRGLYQETGYDGEWRDNPLSFPTPCELGFGADCDTNLELYPQGNGDEEDSCTYYDAGLDEPLETDGMCEIGQDIYWDEAVQRWRDSKTGRFAKPPKPSPNSLKCLRLKFKGMAKKVGFFALCRIAGCLAALTGEAGVCAIYLEGEEWARCWCDLMEGSTATQWLCRAAAYGFDPVKYATGYIGCDAFKDS